MKKSLLLAGAGMCILAGCAAPQPDATLTSAQQRVGLAANNADVVNYAQPQLRTAQNELEQADAALNDGDMAKVDHHALLATRYAETAQQVAQEKRAEQALTTAPLARDQALLQNAQAEAQRAREEAARARSQQGIVLTPRDIVFKSGSAQLDANASMTLQQVAQYLRANPGRKVMIQGFTDSTGSAAVNQQLSQERADAVRLALEQQGVDVGRVQIAGMGPSAPIASNNTAAGRVLNRRVSILISNADGTFPSPSGASGSSLPPPTVAR